MAAAAPCLLLLRVNIASVVIAMCTPSQSSCLSHLVIVSAYRYIAITNLPIIAVFVEYLGQFLIDFNQIYRRSSVP